jgi:cytochrome b subunit of formate dehydrogenase
MMAMADGPRRLVRFEPYQRLLHLVLMVCFLGLAATGLPLLFSDSSWAAALARACGGFEASALLHRVFATGMLLCFTAHVGELAYRLVVRREPGMLWGPSSMVPQPSDVRQFAGHVRWFLGRGPRPAFDRYTYWEKFDYWAVFWGMFIIGGSGLLLWFPHVFSTWLPGWVFNVALLIHGEEALLAVGFIFTIHFFNGHLRPEKFPMDMVMFTGQVSEEELKRERPAEYERLVRENRLRDLVVPEEPPWVSTGGRIIGTLAVTSGLLLLVFILRGVFG